MIDSSQLKRITSLVQAIALPWAPARLSNSDLVSNMKPQGGNYNSYQVLILSLSYRKTFPIRHVFCLEGFLFSPWYDIKWRRAKGKNKENQETSKHSSFSKKFQHLLFSYKERLLSSVSCHIFVLSCNYGFDSFWIIRLLNETSKFQLRNDVKPKFCRHSLWSIKDILKTIEIDNTHES